MDFETFTVPEQTAHQRLDVFLTAQLGLSRSRLQRSIEAGDVLVNGKTARSSHRLRAGDTIEIDLPEPATTELIPEDLPLNILYEDEDLLVLDKPAGMVVHPAAGISHGTLANALAFHLNHPSPGEDLLRPGLVHRLDKDTSGLIVVAKNDAALDHVATQFRDRTVEKHYTALVYGQVPRQQGVIDAPLARDKKNRLKMAVCRPGEGRSALSMYRVKRYFQDFTLLDVEIKTGRTHQIRVHCAHLKHPIVADEIYGKGRAANVPNPVYRQAIATLGRQFLHAAQLSLTHPRSGERLHFAAALPEDLQNFLHVLE